MEKREMIGTERQVKWAEEIVKKKVEEIDKIIAMYENNIKLRKEENITVPKRSYRKIEEFNNLKNEILNCNSAVKIIDHYSDMEISDR